MTEQRGIPKTSAGKRSLLEQRLSEGIAALVKSASGSTPAPAGPVHDPDLFQPFPLTDTQEAYWVGRQAAFELGGTSLHSYRESELEDLDLSRLNDAWMQLVQRHAALRTVVTESGTQRIVEDVPAYHIALTDLREQKPADAEQQLLAVRHDMSHRLYPLDTWPHWEIRATRLDERRTRLHISFDGILIDDRSYQILIREWFKLYLYPGTSLPPLGFSFREYVLAERAQRESESYRLALEYWRERITRLAAAPELPMPKGLKATTGVRFTRYQDRLDPDSWERLKQLCLAHKITTAGLLLSCFMEVLRRWSKSPQLTVSVPTLNRPPLHPDIHDIVGDFSSFILIGNDGATSGTFLARIRTIQQHLWEGLNHSQVSGVRILRELMMHRKTTAAVQMPVVFTMASNLRDSQGTPATGKNESAGVLYGITQTPQVYLDHQAAEMQQALNFNWDVIDELFPPGLMQTLFSAYGTLLRNLAIDPALLEASHPVGLPDEQRLERERANATDTPVIDGRLNDFGGGAVPAAPAVIDDERTLSHGELESLSDQLALRLQHEQVRPNELVAILADKGWRQVVAAHAVLKAGAAYLPVAMDLPADYRQQLLEQAAVRLVLTQAGHDPGVDAERRSYLLVDAPRMSVDAMPPSTPSANDLAYVIFTSGSTGAPKGVMITHQSAVNTVHDINTRFKLGADDRVLGISALNFDLSVYDIFGTRAVGACLVLPSGRKTRDPAYLLNLMHEQGVTVWNSVPALMEMVVQYAQDTGARLPSTLRLVMLSGDWIPVSLPERIRALCGHAQIISLGGATEAAIWSIAYPIEQVDDRWVSIPYGTPLANQRFHVLDAQDQDCPTWVAGRLCIEGTGVAAGYWRDPAQTERRFRHRAGSGVRLYDTGDWGRYLPGGLIEFLGREDRQVKINGYRIELDEIESALSRHPATERAIVLKNAAGQLHAFVVPRNDAALAAEDLKAFLAACLPAYMVPAQIQPLDALPLTGNGKVDQVALLGMLATEQGRTSESPARSARAERLLDDVRQVLKIDTLDTRKSLIELGASSLEIVRIGNLARSYAPARLRVEDYFAAPSLDTLLTAFVDEPRVQTPDRPSRQTLAMTRASLEPALSIAPGGAHRLPTGAAVQLLRGPESENEAALRERRRSHRRYALQPIPFRLFGEWLQSLASFAEHGRPRYRYASAGGLYPVQAYLYVKPGRIHGLLGGHYYYHPEQHRLFELGDGVAWDRQVYGEQNRVIFDHAALCVLLVCPVDLVETHYGEWGYDLAMFEAGSIAQVLRDAAAPLGLGICSIGTLDFARVRQVLGLDDRHLLLHSFVGGAIDPHADQTMPESGSRSDFERAAQLLQRIAALGDTDAEYLSQASSAPASSPSPRKGSA
ncbi:non-ribosomal peptide synthetase [Dyella flagellata]|uniref:Amino acid adenylation domain-containing protein n=1 Tax=Dyella flagellata TaxID=1867833 RepID=A0ABQ5X8E8_9GAMM|nr:amino acid adenylation domain-containing protein [Dyella flagellata]GLQ87907.1 hypothetical protein GCM10007898_14750 [Dyella flagellata]